jgi:hypothetical protein
VTQFAPVLWRNRLKALRLSTSRGFAPTSSAENAPNSGGGFPFGNICGNHRAALFLERLTNSSASILTRAGPVATAVSLACLMTNGVPTGTWSPFLRGLPALVIRPDEATVQRLLAGILLLCVRPQDISRRSLELGFGACVTVSTA